MKSSRKLRRYRCLGKMGHFRLNTGLEKSERWATSRSICVGVKSTEPQVPRTSTVSFTAVPSHKDSMRTLGLWLLSTLWWPYLVLHIFYFREKAYFLFLLFSFPSLLSLFKISPLIFNFVLFVLKIFSRQGMNHQEH